MTILFSDVSSQMDLGNLIMLAVAMLVLIVEVYVHFGYLVIRSHLPALATKPFQSLLCFYLYLQDVRRWGPSSDRVYRPQSPNLFPFFVESQPFPWPGFSSAIFDTRVFVVEFE